MVCGINSLQTGSFVVGKEVACGYRRFTSGASDQTPREKLAEGSIRGARCEAAVSAG